jgi:hypothetical protein
METKYYEWSTYEPRTLMRRTEDFQDQIFINGIWSHTDRILGYMLKGDFGVDPIDTQSAIDKYPEAFGGAKGI